MINFNFISKKHFFKHQNLTINLLNKNLLNA